MQVFDKEGALDRVAGDKGFLFELFEIALEDSKERIEKIKAAIDTNNFKELAETAHALKSAMGNVGAMTCHAACFALERMGKSSDITNAKQELNNLFAQMDLFKIEIERFSKEA
jgi:HPt (histidine-containing phosphotransfer) domain-containing protein